MKRFISLVLAISIIAVTIPAQAQEGRDTVIIRDTEIEAVIREWTEPVIRAAGLDPEAVNFILVRSDDLNAFVAGGQNVFIYTGLLERTENAGEVVGVVAHELGHIRGGHLVRTRGAMESASYESLIGTLLGLGAAIATGEGGLGAAVAAGSRSAAVSRFLAFSRVQESSADQAGMSYMEKAGVDPRGLVSFMEKLASQELLPPEQQSEYVRTHPLARDRIEALEAGYERSANKGVPPSAQWKDQHGRVLAKLKAFIHPERIEWDYGGKDLSVTAEYARAIAAYRNNRVEEALAKMDGLLDQEPDNPFFLELKGQMLRDFGRLEESVPVYRRAVELYPDGPLIRTAYAHALIETAEKSPENIGEAIRQLDRSVRDDPRSTLSFRLLATAYGRKGQEAMAKLYLAEEALLRQQRDLARQQAQAAREGLEKGSRPWLRAQDILAYLDAVGEK